MSILKEKFKKHIWNLPKIDDYLFGTIIFNKYPEDTAIRYGAFFSQGDETDFLLLIEVYPKPKDLSKYSSKEKEGITFYYDYKPDFTVIPDWTGAISTTNLNKIFTILNLTNIEDTEKLLEKAISSEPVMINEELQTQYELNKHLPDMVNGWELVTMFFGYSSFEYDGRPHNIIHCQGNYRKNQDYINIELKFGCVHAIYSSKLMAEGLVLSQDTFENPAIKQGKVENMNYMYSENQTEKYSVAVHDNPTNKKLDFDSMYKLINATLDILKHNI